jgi:hypothetical protein
MAKHPFNLTDDELKEIKDNKPGIFSEAETRDFFKINNKKENKADEPITFAELKKNFVDVLAGPNATFDENLNMGMYVRIDELRNILDEFSKKEKLTHLHIGFGLRKAKKIDGEEIDWNCLHLIMQGAIPIAETDPVTKRSKAPTQFSKRRFSTYDGDEITGTGPKPGCPPFGSVPEDGSNASA